MSRLGPTRSTRSESFTVPLLVAATAAWGSTFVVVKYAVARMPVMDFLAWRFVIATIALALIVPRSVAAIDRKTLLRGLLLGLSLAGGYIAQTYGLRYTSAATSGFITGMFVVFTPLLSGALLHKRVGAAAWAAVVLATIGLGVISLHGLSIGLGEALTLLCAFIYAFQVLGLGEWSADHNPYALTIVQLATVGIVMMLVQAPFGLGPPHGAGVWAAVLVTAIPATTVAFVVQTWGQSYMSATRAAVVLTMEPVFAGIAAAIAGEVLGWRIFVGGALVLAAMYLVQLGGQDRYATVAVPSGEVAGPGGGQPLRRPPEERVGYPRPSPSPG